MVQIRRDAGDGLHAFGPGDQLRLTPKGGTNAAPIAFQGEKPDHIGRTTPICPTLVSAQPGTGGIEGLSMLGYILISAIVSGVLALAALAGLTIHVCASVAITYRAPENAADIITAMGKYFPFKGWFSRWRK
ncbi:hypothetical protein [Mycobacterium sp. 1081908.1]|uniref:hypothetical protein n=1 Tax=Mycobacterium sp. 1081908.1 TaxID=1834066 RepID=UPI0012EA19BA|nr:hypothetical protein [Mycobacterium sp. 1081908.1]